MYGVPYALFPSGVMIFVMGMSLAKKGREGWFWLSSEGRKEERVIRH